MPQARAETWPTRPIRLIIPYAAGGAGDATFRQVAPIVEKRIGQPFVIENKPGAGGNIGAAVQIAVLANKAALSAGDFLVI